MDTNELRPKRRWIGFYKYKKKTPSAPFNLLSEWIGLCFFIVLFLSAFAGAAVSVVVVEQGPVDIFTYRIICFRDRRCAV